MQALQDEASSFAAAEMSKAEARESSTTAKGGDKKRKTVTKTSTGVSKLKKANTTGMAKLSTFFEAKSK
jgi:ribonuclease H2 subunit B